MALVLLAVLFLLLFAVAFFSKRRFGVLGLGLCAGALLAEPLSDLFAMVLSAQDIGVGQMSNQTLATIILTLIPSLLLLAGGPRYLGKVGAVIGGIGYGFLALLLLLGPLTLSINDPDSQAALGAIAPYETALIAGLVALALGDMMLAQGPRLGRSHDKGKH